MQDTQPKRNTRLFQNTDLTNRYGRTQRTVDRWKRKKILPPPDLIINGAPYWYPETIEANERAHLSGNASAADAAKAPDRASGKDSI
jgi:hypothetical protein